MIYMILLIYVMQLPYVGNPILWWKVVITYIWWWEKFYVIIDTENAWENILRDGALLKLEI